LFHTPQALQPLGTAIQTLEQNFANAGSIQPKPVLQWTDAVLNAYRVLAHDFPKKSEADEMLADYTEKVREVLQEAEGTAQAQRSRLDDVEEQSATLEKKLVDLTQRGDAQVTRVDQAVTDANDKISRLTTEIRENASAAETQRKEDWAEEITNATTEADDAARALEDALRKRHDEVHVSASASVAEIDKLKTEAGRIVNLISDSGLAGHYQKLANKSSKWGFTYTVAAFLLFSVPLGVGIWTFNSLPESGNPSWPWLAIRLAIGLAALVPATFIATEAVRLKRLELASRQRELEFSTLSSFLDELSEEERGAIRKTLASEYFAKPMVPDLKASSDRTRGVSAHELLKVGERILKALGK
jgi:predicted  nucleic acid-binding Zn-ribbon protein